MSSLLSLTLLGLLFVPQDGPSDDGDDDLAPIVLDPANREAFRQNPDWRYNATLVGILYPTTDFDETTGDLSTKRTQLRIGGRKPIDEKRTLSWGIGHERSNYDFSSDVLLGGIGDPFSRVHQTSVGTSLIIQASEDVTWLANVFVRAGAESGASLSDSAVYGGGGTVTFPALDSIRMTLGGFVTTRLEDDPFFFPWFQIDWQVSEKLHVGQEGTGVGIGYLFSEQVKSYANLFYSVRQYRLKSSSGNPLPSGVGRDDEYGLNVGATWTVNDSLRIDFFGGVNKREITLLDNNRNVGQSELDPAPYFGIALSYVF